MYRIYIGLCAGCALLAPSIVSAQDTPRVSNDVRSRLAEILEKPFTITEEKAIQYEIRVPIRRYIVTYERYGLFGRRCRRVVRQVIRYRSETRTRTVTVARSLPPLTQPARVSSPEPITLPGVSSLAARPRLIDLATQRHFDMNGTVVASEFGEDYAKVRVSKGQAMFDVAILLVVNEPRDVQIDIDFSGPGDKPTQGQTELDGLSMALKNLGNIN